MLLVVTAAIVTAVALLSIALSIVEFRKVTPLAFRCQRCGASFEQPAHQPSPAACPRCGATEWAM